MLLLMGTIRKQEILAAAQSSLRSPVFPLNGLYRNPGHFAKEKMAILDNMLRILQSLPIEAVGMVFSSGRNNNPGERMIS